MAVARCKARSGRIIGGKGAKQEVMFARQNYLKIIGSNTLMITLRDNAPPMPTLKRWPRWWHNPACMHLACDSQAEAMLRLRSSASSARLSICICMRRTSSSSASVGTTSNSKLKLLRASHCRHATQRRAIPNASPSPLNTGLKRGFEDRQGFCLLHLTQATLVGM